MSLDYVVYVIRGSVHSRSPRPDRSLGCASTDAASSGSRFGRGCGGKEQGERFGLKSGTHVERGQQRARKQTQNPKCGDALFQTPTNLVAKYRPIAGGAPEPKQCRRRGESVPSAGKTRIHQRVLTRSHSRGDSVLLQDLFHVHNLGCNYEVVDLLYTHDKIRVLVKKGTLQMLLL